MQSHCIEKIQVTKLHRLRKEEEVLKKVLKKYKDGLHALQIEELTIKYEVGKMRNNESDSQNNSLAPDIGGFHTLSSVNPGSDVAPDINNQLVSLTSLNLEVTPLIERMLYDSMAYEEEGADA